TLAASKEQYLMRPDLGRQLGPAARDTLAENCPVGADLQVAVGDGLSAAAVAAQVPALLPLLAEQARERGWRFGRPFFVRYCRRTVPTPAPRAPRPHQRSGRRLPAQGRSRAGGIAGRPQSSLRVQRCSNSVAEMFHGVGLNSRRTASQRGAELSERRRSRVKG